MKLKVKKKELLRELHAGDLLNEIHYDQFYHYDLHLIARKF